MGTLTKFSIYNRVNRKIWWKTPAEKTLVKKFFEYPTLLSSKQGNLEYYVQLDHFEIPCTKEFKVFELFLPFGGLIWIFVYVLAAQTSACQAHPKFKTVRKRVWKNNLRVFKKICLL